MEFSNKNSKKLKLMFVALVVALIGTSQSVHATPRNDKLETCLDIEMDDGKSDKDVFKECCEYSGGVPFGTDLGDGATQWECIYANDLEDTGIQPTQQLPHHINPSTLTTTTLQQTTVQTSRSIRGISNMIRR